MFKLAPETAKEKPSSALRRRRRCRPPEALERDKERTLGDIAVLYNDRYDGNLISGFATQAGMEFVRIDNGAPIPATPLIRWLQDCAEWCAAGWQNAHPRLAWLIKSWIRFNPSLSRNSDMRQIQNTLVNYLFENRAPDQVRELPIAFAANHCNRGYTTPTRGVSVFVRLPVR